MIDPYGWGDWGFIDLPDWARPLGRMYVWLRLAHRGRPKPSRRTWWRRIAAEKKRLLSEGVSHIEIHLVTRYLANPRSQSAQRRWRQYTEAKAQGASPWI